MEVVYKNISNRLKESFIKNNFPKFYEFIIQNYNEDTFLEKIYVFYNGGFLCHCGNKTKFRDFKNGYFKHCSSKCSSVDSKVRDKYKKTCNDKYGYDNVSKDKIIKDKKENTFLSRYGKKTYLLTDNVKDTIKEKYGVDNVFQLEIIKDKIKKTNTEKYGVTCFTKTNEYLEKTKKTNMEKYGFSSYSKTDEYKSNLSKKIYEIYKDNFNIDGYKIIDKNKTSNTLLHKTCGNKFQIQSQLIRKKSNNNIDLCPFCNPVIPSHKEIELFDFIKNLNVKAVHKYRDKYEIDIYLPDLKLGFEFNGLYWHSELYKDKNYHLDKTNYFKERGIQIIHIWEDDWIFKQDIIKSMILNKIGNIENKIFARKCSIIEINNNQSNEFLNKNHIQGWCVSKHRIALVYEDEIVCLMTIGKERINLGNIPNSTNYELLRFCNKLNFTVIGGFTKLLRYFIKKYNPIKITTYADFSISNGNVYLKNGFSFIKNTNPNYHYFLNNKRINRFNFTKQKLVKKGHDKNKTEKEIMFEIGYLRLYDCGSMKFEMDFTH